MNSAIPESRVRRLQIFDQLLDMAPDGISGNVGVDCPGEKEPFVEELVEGIEFRGVDFRRSYHELPSAIYDHCFSIICIM